MATPNKVGGLSMGFSLSVDKNAQATIKVAKDQNKRPLVNSVSTEALAELMVPQINPKLSSNNRMNSALLLVQQAVESELNQGSNTGVSITDLYSRIFELIRDDPEIITTLSNDAYRLFAQGIKQGVHVAKKGSTGKPDLATVRANAENRAVSKEVESALGLTLDTGDSM